MNALQTQYADFPKFYPKLSESQYVDQFTDYFENERASGKMLYFMTLTYNDHKDFPLTAEKACRYFKEFRKHLLHKMFGSKYNSPKYREIEPRVFAFLDTSFSKRKTRKLAKAPKHESRFHHHCVFVVNSACSNNIDFLLDRISRAAFRESLTSKLQIRSIDFQKIKPTKDDTRAVVDYCSETARLSPHDETMLQIFPISKSEFRN